MRTASARCSSCSRTATNQDSLGEILRKPESVPEAASLTCRSTHKSSHSCGYHTRATEPRLQSHFKTTVLFPATVSIHMVPYH